MGALLDRMRKDQERAKQGDGLLFFLKEGDKKDVRFLRDLEDAVEVPWHFYYDRGESEVVVDSPCLKAYGRECPHCGSEEKKVAKTQMRYAYPIYQYEGTDKTKGRLMIFCFNVSSGQFSPMGPLMDFYEEADDGDLRKRDFRISLSGTGLNKKYKVVPSDPKTFRHKDTVKPLTDEGVLKLIWKSKGSGKLADYPELDEEPDESDDEVEEEEEE